MGHIRTATHHPHRRYNLDCISQIPYIACARRHACRRPPQPARAAPDPPAGLGASASHRQPSPSPPEATSEPPGLRVAAISRCWLERPENHPHGRRGAALRPLSGLPTPTCALHTRFRRRRARRRPWRQPARACGGQRPPQQSGRPCRQRPRCDDGGLGNGSRAASSTARSRRARSRELGLEKGRAGVARRQARGRQGGLMAVCDGRHKIEACGAGQHPPTGEAAHLQRTRMLTFNPAEKYIAEGCPPTSLGWSR